jgi:dienelactone hydrolase
MAQLPPLSPVEMTVAAGDGVVLKGVLEYPDEPAGGRYPLAVLAHQYPATAESFAPFVADLLDMGVATLAFDMRGHGSSIMTHDGPLVIDTPLGFGMDAFGTAFMGSARKVSFQRIADDILRVAAWGACQNFIDPSRILLGGASVGGTGVLLAAPTITGLRGVVTFGAAGAPVHGDDAPERIRANVRALAVPSLLASSEGDPFDGAKSVREWSDGVDGATATVVPGDAHAMAIYYDVRDEVVQFVGRALGLGGR